MGLAGYRPLGLRTSLAIVLIVSPGFSGQIIKFWNAGPVLSTRTTIEFTKLGAHVTLTSWQWTRLSEVLEIATRCSGMTLPAALCMFMFKRQPYPAALSQCHLFQWNILSRNSAATGGKGVQSTKGQNAKLRGIFQFLKFWYIYWNCIYVCTCMLHIDAKPSEEVIVI